MTTIFTAPSLSAQLTDEVRRLDRAVRVLRVVVTLDVLVAIVVMVKRLGGW